MKTFRYRAKKSAAEVQEGVCQADSADEVIAKMNDAGLAVVHIEEAATAEPGSVSTRTSDVEQTVYRGLASVMITRFYKQLGRILRSGVPILQALQLIQGQAEKTQFREMIGEIRARVAEGHPLSQALAHYRNCFSSFDLALIEAGEMVGRLDDSLKRIAQHREEQEKLSSKVRGALAYPLFIMAAGFAAMVFMLVYVLPKFSDFFLNLGQELPLLTRLLIETSQLAQKGFWGIIAVLCFFIFVMRRAFKSQANRLGWHRFYLRLPHIGKLILFSQFARLARTLSLLLESGIPLLKAVEASLPVLTNEVIRTELLSCHSALKQGVSLGESLQQSAHAPALVVQLVRSGEEAGRLQESLNDIAEGYEQELQEQVEVFTKLLEPLLILVVGAILGLMIVAVLLPVFSLNAAIS